MVADMCGACADGRGHVRMLARWLREFEFEWDSEAHESCVWRRTRELRMVWYARVAEVACEMFGRGQVQGHVGAWCVSSVRPRWGVVRKTRKALDCVSETLDIHMS